MTSQLLKWSYLSNCFAGIMTGFYVVMLDTAVAALLFQGELAPFLGVGITCVFIGTLVVNLFLTLFGHVPFFAACSDVTSSSILSVMFIHIAGHTSPDALFPTIFIALALNSVGIGLSLLLLGYFKLGHIVRFVPYPVVGGFLVSSGWLLLYKSFSIVTNHPLTLKNLLNFGFDFHYGISLGFALSVFAAVRYYRKQWILPLAIILATLVFHGGLKIAGFSHEQAIQSGWLFSLFKREFIWQVANTGLLQQIDWFVLFTQIGYILTIIGIIASVLLLNISVLEIVLQAKINFDHELKSFGASNTLAGLIGGGSANIVMNASLMNRSLGATHRIAGICLCLTVAFIVFINPGIVSYMPKPIIGGLVMMVSFNIFIDWLYEAYYKLPLLDYFIIIFILLIAITLGFLPSIAIGIILNCLIFIMRYAKIKVIKYALTGNIHRSQVLRSEGEQKWLDEHGQSIQIFRLQGYLFFGSAKELLEEALVKIEKRVISHLQFIIFDFQLVNAVDSSASFSFIRLQQLNKHSKVKLIFTACSEIILQQFKHSGVLSPDTAIKIFPNLDYGLEWCENQLLINAKLIPFESKLSINELLKKLIPEIKDHQLFLEKLVRLEIPNNEYVFHQHEHSDSLYFVESGEVSILLEKGQQGNVRLAKSGPGTIIGEIGFYLNEPRTASVRAEKACILYKLDKHAIQALEKEEPQIMLHFHLAIIRILGERLMRANEELKQIW